MKCNVFTLHCRASWLPVYIPFTNHHHRPTYSALEWLQTATMMKSILLRAASARSPTLALAVTRPSRVPENVAGLTRVHAT